MNAIMAQVIIRNLDPGVVERLKARAKRHGRSLEGELREILSESVASTRNEELVAFVDEHRLPAIPGVDIMELFYKARENRTEAILRAALGDDS
jgi:plasmid stability protein